MKPKKEKNVGTIYVTIDLDDRAFRKKLDALIKYAALRLEKLQSIDEVPIIAQKGERILSPRITKKRKRS